MAIGYEHPLVAGSYQNLARLYLKQGNQVQAKEMASKAYHIHLNVLGPEHPKGGSTSFGLGTSRETVTISGRSLSRNNTQCFRSAVGRPLGQR